MEVTPPPSSSGQLDADIEFLASGSLARRQGGGGGGEGGARLDAAAAGGNGPPSGRQYVYRQNADYDSLIEACSRKLTAQPGNLRALMIRANSYAKKGGCRCPDGWLHARIACLW